MPLTHPKYTVAVIQAASIWLDLCAGIDKTIALIKEAAKNGAKLVAFPETWLLVYGRDPWDVRSLTCSGRTSFIWTTGRFGSGCVNPLFNFVAGKQPLKIGFPEAASRQ